MSNIDVSQRVGQVMAVMSPSLSAEQRAEIMDASRKAKSFSDLAVWIQTRVVEAEALIRSGIALADIPK